MNIIENFYIISRQYIRFLDYRFDANLKNKDADQFISFLNDIKNNAPDGYYFASFDYDEVDNCNYKICEVTNLLNDCIILKAMYLKIKPIR